MEGNFKEHAQHLEGCAVRLAATQNFFASFGSDDAVFTLDMRSQRAESNTLDNPDREEITALAIDSRNMNSFVVGTASGCVKRLWPKHQFRLRQAGLMYKCDRPIKALSFHPKGKILGIATDDEQAILYSIIDKRVITLKKAHEGGATNVFFAGGYVCSLGLEGYLHLYQLKLPPAMQASDDSDSEEPQVERAPIECVFMDRYKISTDAVTRRHPYFNAEYAEFKGQQGQKVILASGQTSLQVIQLEGRSSNYRIERAIREQEEILLIQILSQGDRGFPNCIVTSSASSLSIWNYNIKQRLFALSTAQNFKGSITSMVKTNSPEGPVFLFAINHTASSGKFYQFANPAILNGPPLPYENQITEATQPKPKKEKAPFVSRWEKETQLEKLLPDFTQHLLEKSYQQSQGARFLFYNSEGCIIERTDGGNSNIQLQLHDKSKHKRIKLDLRNKPIWLFALRQDVLVYASGNSVVFQCERHLREGHEGWEFKWDNIQAVAIGYCWVAVCSQNAVKILDYSGNELHTFCFDRKLVAFQAYEDTLAMTFHSALPMWQCQALKVRIYRITPETVTIQRDTLLPMKANSHLKWFGFSEEGMLYCQDTFEVLRGYIFERDQWIPVHSLDFTAQRLFIQHISGTNVYGFKMDQKGKSEEPKVTPRSLPRRFPMDLPAIQLEFLTKEEDSHFRRLRLRNIQLEHQRFRYQRWYKFKYSRSKNHLWYSISESILSEEQLRTAYTQVDYQLLDHLKKFVKRWEDKRIPDYQHAARSLILILQRQAHFPDDTLSSAREILGVNRIQKSQIYEDSVVMMRHSNPSCKTKMKQMNMLEKMLNVMAVI